MNKTELLIQPSEKSPAEIEIRFTGISIHFDDNGEKIERTENYYLPFTRKEDILQISWIVNETNIENFNRLLYYPQTREDGQELSKTIVMETCDENGARDWKTIGFIWGVDTSDLEELEFERWQKDDYKSTRTDLDILTAKI